MTVLTCTRRRHRASAFTNPRTSTYVINGLGGYDAICDGCWMMNAAYREIAYSKDGFTKEELEKIIQVDEILTK